MKDYVIGAELSEVSLWTPDDMYSIEGSSWLVRSTGVNTHSSLVHGSGVVPSVISSRALYSQSALEVPSRLSVKWNGRLPTSILKSKGSCRGWTRRVVTRPSKSVGSSCITDCRSKIAAIAITTAGLALSIYSGFKLKNM